jgi:hypothetical protein
MYYLCSVVQVLMICLCIVVSMGLSFLCFTPFRDFYHTRTKEYLEAITHLSCDVCKETEKRIQTISVNNCIQSEQIVFGSWPIERAVVDTFRNLHPCSDGGCNSLFTSLGLSGLIGYFLLATTGVVLLVVGVSAFSHYSTAHNAATRPGQPNGTGFDDRSNTRTGNNVYYVMQTPYNYSGADVDDESHFFNQAYNTRNRLKKLEYVENSKKQD